MEEKPEITITSVREQFHQLRCPACNALIDGMTGLHRGKIAKPKAGDVSFCYFCATVLVMIDSFASYRSLSLRAATEQEREIVLRDPVWAHLQKSIRKQGLTPKKG